MIFSENRYTLFGIMLLLLHQGPAADAAVAAAERAGAALPGDAAADRGGQATAGPYPTHRAAAGHPAGKAFRHHVAARDDHRGSGLFGTGSAKARGRPLAIETASAAATTATAAAL